MTVERSTPQTHRDSSAQRLYDENYYRELLPFCKGVVLDLGCGVGMFTKEILKKEEVTMIYAYDKFPAWQRITTAGPKLANRECDLEKGFPPFEGKLDTVVMTEFIEHIDQEAAEVLLAKISQILNPDGLFIGSTPIKTVPTTNIYHKKEYEWGELETLLKKFFKDVQVRNIGLGCQIWIAK